MVISGGCDGDFGDGRADVFEGGLGERRSKPIMFSGLWILGPGVWTDGDHVFFRLEVNDAKGVS